MTFFVDTVSIWLCGMLLMTPTAMSAPLLSTWLVRLPVNHTFGHLYFKLVRWLRYLIFLTFKGLYENPDSCLYWILTIHLMSKMWEVFAQSSEPEAHVKNAWQTKDTKTKYNVMLQHCSLCYAVELRAFLCQCSWHAYLLTCLLLTNLLTYTFFKLPSAFIYCSS